MRWTPSPFNEAKFAFLVIIYMSLVLQALVLAAAVYISASLRPVLFVENYKPALIGLTIATIAWAWLTIVAWFRRSRPKH